MLWVALGKLVFGWAEPETRRRWRDHILNTFEIIQPNSKLIYSFLLFQVINPSIYEYACYP